MPYVSSPRTERDESFPARLADCLSQVLAPGHCHMHRCSCQRNRQEHGLFRFPARHRPVRPRMGGLAWSWTSMMTIRCASAWRACRQLAAGSTRLSPALYGAGRCRRAVHDRGGKGAAGDQLLGLRAGAVPSPACHAGARRRAHRADELHRRRHRHPVPGFLQPRRAWGSLAYEVAPFGVHVTPVELGNVRTDLRASRRLAAIRSTAPALPGPSVSRNGMMRTACQPPTWPPWCGGGIPPPAPEGVGRQDGRAGGPAGQATAAVPHLRGRDGCQNSWSARQPACPSTAGRAEPDVLSASGRAPACEPCLRNRQGG